ncbi:hypothetical protein BGZ68_002608 [Mortierella alpina]|nr:hypothetical protein BGZ68_002608 [Mortierella alpina]
MPSRVSVELSPSSSTNSMTSIPSPASLTTITSATAAVPTAFKKSQLSLPLDAISTSPPRSAGMDDATMGHPHASPSSTSSSSPSLSSSSSSSPVSSTFSLPAAVTATSTLAKGKGKAVYNHTEIARDRALLASSELPANDSASAKFCATHRSSDASLPTTDQQQQQQQDAGDDKDDDNIGKRNGKGKGKGKDEGTSAATVDTSSDMYTHSSAGSSNSSSLSTLSSVEEESDEQLSSTSSLPPSSSKKIFAGAASKSRVSRTISSYGEGSSQGSSSGSSTSHPRVASSSAQSSRSQAGCSGSGSKPALTRAATGPASFHRPNLTSQASSSAIPQVPTLPDSTTDKELNTLQDFRLLSYDAIPEDFDFGDLPFYDTDPMTGIIYGDPHAITRPYLVPEMYYDHYRVHHDSEDPRRTNIFNKHGTLLYYHPGRHIGQEQDSLRSQLHNQAMWTMAGRSSTWGTLTATEMATKRQIKIVQEINKKKAAAATAAAGAESTEPLSRFVFRWKEDDFVVEYRKVKDQYRITCFQMCGGKSKWRPPQANPTQTMFHGIGMEGPGNPYTAHTIGTPSPFDATRYLQLISEYRLNSGPVHKRGDFELYNPDTFPAEFRSFLVLLSIVILDVVRPVDDKQFYKEFPHAATKSYKVAGVGGLRTQAGALAPVGGHMGQMAIVGQVGSASASALHTNNKINSRSSPISIVTSKSATSSEEGSSPPYTAFTPNVAPISTTVTGAKTAPVVSGKKSRWANIFKK